MRLSQSHLTLGLVAINVILFIAMLVPSVNQTFLVSGAFFPFRLLGGNAGLIGSGTIIPAWITPVSAAFLHGGLTHLMFNMLMLILIGHIIERVLGWKYMALLYVIGIYSAASAEMIVHPSSQNPIIGASGAISALMGAYVMLFPNKPPKSFGSIPAHIARPIHMLLGWISINFMMAAAGPGMGMNIAIYSHIGGFIAGLILAKPLLLLRYRKA